MSENDFDESEVIALVESALAKNVMPEQTIPLSLAQGELFEHLYNSLSKYMATGDVQMLLEDLRTKLFSGLSLSDLKSVHRISRACMKCAAVRNSEPYLPEWNLSDPDCLLIAEQPSTYQDYNDILISGIKDAGFSSSRICLTYINRCTTKSKYEAEHIRNCLPYLHTEIELLKPKLIICLGLLPLTSLFGQAFKLGEVRGSIMWLGPWAILPTYSPMYVLKAGGRQLEDFKSDIAFAKSFCYG